MKCFSKYCSFKEEIYPKEKELTIDLCVSLNIFATENDTLIKECTSDTLISLNKAGIKGACNIIEDIIIKEAFKNLKENLYEYFENAFRIKKNLESVKNSYKTDKILMILHNFRSVVFVYNLCKGYCEILTVDTKGYRTSLISVNELDNEYRDYYILNESPLKGKDIKDIKRKLDMTLNTEELKEIINYILELKDDFYNEREEILWQGIDNMVDLKNHIESIVYETKHSEDA